MKHCLFSGQKDELSFRLENLLIAVDTVTCVGSKSIYASLRADSNSCTFIHVWTLLLNWSINLFLGFFFSRKIGKILCNSRILDIFNGVKSWFQCFFCWCFFYFDILPGLLFLYFLLTSALLSVMQLKTRTAVAVIAFGSVHAYLKVHFTIFFALDTSKCCSKNVIKYCWS